MERASAWTEMWTFSRGQPVALVETQLRDLQPKPLFPYPRYELELQLTARVMSDRRWLYKHPLAALDLAWRHRELQSLLRTLNWLRKPRSQVEATVAA